ANASRRTDNSASRPIIGRLAEVPRMVIAWHGGPQHRRQRPPAGRIRPDSQIVELDGGPSVRHPVGRTACSWKSGCVERVTGIEPALPAWEAGVLPLNYTRVPADLASGSRPILATRRRLANLGECCFPIAISRPSS